MSGVVLSHNYVQDESGMHEQHGYDGYSIPFGTWKTVGLRGHEVAWDFKVGRYLEFSDYLFKKNRVIALAKFTDVNGSVHEFYFGVIVRDVNKRKAKFDVYKLDDKDYVECDCDNVSRVTMRYPNDDRSVIEGYQGYLFNNRLMDFNVGRNFCGMLPNKCEFDYNRSKVSIKRFVYAMYGYGFVLDDALRVSDIARVHFSRYLDDDCTSSLLYLGPILYSFSTRLTKAVLLA